MIHFSELLRQNKTSLHCRTIVDGKTFAIFITNANGDLEYWMKDDEMGTLEFEKHRYTFISNNQNHITKVLKSA